MVLHEIRRQPIYSVIYKREHQGRQEYFQVSFTAADNGETNDFIVSFKNINNVLDMGRIESGKVKIDEKPLHLPNLLHDIRTIIQPIISSKQLDFLIDTVDAVDEDAFADTLRLTQVLLNILDNGVKVNKTGSHQPAGTAEKRGGRGQQI